MDLLIFDLMVKNSGLRLWNHNSKMVKSNYSICILQFMPAISLISILSNQFLQNPSTFFPSLIPTGEKQTSKPTLSSKTPAQSSSRTNPAQLAEPEAPDAPAYPSLRQSTKTPCLSKTPKTSSEVTRPLNLRPAHT